MNRQREILRRYRAKHRAEINARARARYAANREKELARQKEYRDSNREMLRERSRTLYETKPERKAYKAALERTEKQRAARRAYREANPPTSEYYRTSAYRERRRELHREKQTTDVQYRLRRTLRARLKNAIKNDQKSGSAVSLLGCSVSGLRAFLEGQFEAGMSWDNFGRLDASGKTWQIDHFHPLSGFDLTDPKQMQVACHFSNLMPLWALDNRRKANKSVSRKEVPYA